MFLNFNILFQLFIFQVKELPAQRGAPARAQQQAAARRAKTRDSDRSRWQRQNELVQPRVRIALVHIHQRRAHRQQHGREPAVNLHAKRRAARDEQNGAARRHQVPLHLRRHRRHREHSAPHSGHALARQRHRHHHLRGLQGPHTGPLADHRHASAGQEGARAHSQRRNKSD